MLKLPKGLKKKKKDKKKKNQELFTEEELEQYKREQKVRQLAEQEEAAQREQSEQQAVSASTSTSKPKTDDDEWLKFNQLTTGIDTVLKKTQNELTRIKEESFYQRIEPPKPQIKSPEPEKELEPQLTEEELQEQRRLQQLKEAVVELSESESESQDSNDIFDTNYIEQLASGELPLAYVPESPEVEDLGPDPFDTNFAEKVIKGPEVSKRGKKIVYIGAAVEVLTGRVDTVALNKAALKRPRRGLQNLLLESFDQDKEDELEVPAKEGETANEQPVLTLLDDTSDVFADAPIDLSASLHLQYLKQREQVEKEAEQKRKELLELQKDEFDELATESLTKKVEVLVVDSSEIITAPIESAEKGWKSEFEEQAELGIVDVYDDEIIIEDEDPFDTQFVASVVREKSIDSDEFDPRAGEPSEVEPIKVENVYAPQSTLKVQNKDLLSGSTSDLTDLSHVPVIAASESIEQEIDPFDTSAVAALVQPKETEIKFLEREFLIDSGLKQSISDPDFDPRGDEKHPQIRNVPINKAERKSSLCLNISVPHTSTVKTVAFDVGSQLSVDNSSETKKGKPVTPYYADKPIDDLSDSEFDPRAITPSTTLGASDKADLLSVENDLNIKVLTPAELNKDELEDNFSIADPFDTSNVSGALLPGKAELKLIENEFIDPVKHTEVAVLDINSDSQELGLGGKVLTPQISLPVEDSFDDIDPFDTSFANNLAPGQAEIKLLESELIHK